MMSRDSVVASALTIGLLVWVPAAVLAQSDSADAADKASENCELLNRAGFVSDDLALLC